MNALRSGGGKILTEGSVCAEKDIGKFVCMKSCKNESLCIASTYRLIYYSIEKAGTDFPCRLEYWIIPRSLRQR